MPYTEELYHYGVLGMKWGIRRYQNYDGSLTDEGRKKYAKDRVFVSGSSKTQDPNSAYYQAKLPKIITKELDSYIRKNKRILVGDAPGIDRQVQDYLKARHYENVEVYSPGNEARYLANKNWQNVKVDPPGVEKGSKEWLAAKDLAMRENATEGMAVVLPGGGASATRNNVADLVANNKKVSVVELGDSSGYRKTGKLSESQIMAECQIQTAMSPKLSRSERIARQIELFNKANNAAYSNDIENKTNLEIGSSIFGRIIEQSGDWYESRPVSAECAKLTAKIHAVRDEWEEKINAVKRTTNIGEKDPQYWDKRHKIDDQYRPVINKLENELDGVALRDIGFEDTPELRDLIYPYRHWD